MLSNKQKKELRENVLRGCALLDRRRPRWFEQIDLDAFDLKSGTFCICGQLAALQQGAELGSSNWTLGFTRLLGLKHSYEWTLARARRHGFTAGTFGPGGTSRDSAWVFSEHVWRDEIAKRRRRSAKAAA